MPFNSFFDGFSQAFLIGGALNGFIFAFFWFCDQEQIEELFLRLENCEENHELKK